MKRARKKRQTKKSTKKLIKKGEIIKYIIYPFKNAYYRLLLQQQDVRHKYQQQ